ncbi:hypothetical protein JCM33374_g207 [Metschnikowia sp. JCM 33374]|nr:hypothetical protein JCM33374_g207 [Metschnikowia sp. JCM 33374]
MNEISSQLNASLFRLKLLDALRAGDESKVNSLIHHLKTVDSTVETSELIKLRETIVHYAVQVAPLQLIQALIENKDFDLDVNAQDSDGNTPLHLAVISSRFHVVKYLMGLPQINDTVLNDDRNQPVELAKDANIAQLMQYERAKFVERSATDLRQFFSQRDYDNLENLLVNNARASELLDINGADPETGNTVLHEFIRKEDLQMCEWILKHGGDPFKRDKRGKLPIDLVSSKADPIRKLLKNASKDQNMMDPTNTSGNVSAPGSTPTYKGYLRKWTNFASGYKLRYFVLDQYGILSYYTNQSDTNNACRGSLNLGFATLHLDSSEKLKFEIIGKNGIKWHLKANHPVETNRWVWTLQNAITISKDVIRRKTKLAPTRVSAESNIRPAQEDSYPIEEEKKKKLLHIPGRKRSHKKSPSQVSISSFTGSEADDNASLNSSDIHASVPKSPILQGNLPQINETRPSTSEFRLNIGAGDDDFDYDLEDSAYSDSGSINLDSSESRASNEQVAATKGSIIIEVVSLQQLFKALSSKTEDGVLEEETYSVGVRTLDNIRSLIESYHSSVQIREAKLLKKIERQQEVNKLWESSIRQLEDEIQRHEQTLAQYEGKKYKLRKLLESKGISAPQINNELASGLIDNRAAAELGATPGNNLESEGDSQLLNEFLYDSDEEFFDADDFDATGQEPQNESEHTSDTPLLVSETKDDKNESTGPESPEYLTKSQHAKSKIIQEEGSFLGYELPPRTKLSMDKDNRPKVGLWGIVKSMVGQDMTKMSLPVSFNECTSLLQRLAEDIEYNDLLTKAASIEDSTLRMVYVAAFAASEYSSTINRIAKPFNPLLGETFEYCRKDQGFRMISEQVSHHPPISACHAESAKWDYYGENAVKSQFRGRSFDFQHLGKMFCTIRPDSGVITKSGERAEEELYSWKKVNTSVVGIIIGNPTVDNYGVMEVCNHTTGDIVQVDLKQRGWKASSAYQLSGVVNDRDGNACWAIGGHWNSKIFGKKVTSDYNSKRRESLVDNSDGYSDPESGNKFLVWQVAPRPDVPFNLTSFAITLNDINEKLKPWLAPTDTRLRPDQRAMEDGRYDEASAEKNRVEEKQRSARRQRELKRESFDPQWFIKSTHPVTGDHYWHFNGTYWMKRKEKKLVGCGDIF